MSASPEENQKSNSASHALIGECSKIPNFPSGFRQFPTSSVSEYCYECDLQNLEFAWIFEPVESIFLYPGKRANLLQVRCDWLPVKQEPLKICLKAQNLLKRDQKERQW